MFSKEFYMPNAFLTSFPGRFYSPEEIFDSVFSYCLNSGGAISDLNIFE